MKYPKLFIAGPTHVPDDVLQAMVIIKIDNKLDKDWLDKFEEIEEIIEIRKFKI